LQKRSKKVRRKERDKEGEKEEEAGAIWRWLLRAADEGRTSHLHSMVMLYVHVIIDHLSIACPVRHDRFFDRLLFSNGNPWSYSSFHCKVRLIEPQIIFGLA